MKQPISRVFISLCLFTTVGIPMKGDLIASEVHASDNSISDIGDPINGENSYTYSTTNNEITGMWSIRILEDHGYSSPIQLTAVPSNQITIEPQSSFGEYAWRNALRFASDDRTHNYFKAQLEFNSNQYGVAITNLVLDLLPTTPVISSQQLTYSYDWEWDTFDSSTLTLTIETGHIARMIAWLSKPGDPFFEPPIQESFTAIYGFDNLDKTAENHTITLTVVDWGQWIKIQSINEFGYSLPSNMICTTDLITDSDILARIEYIKEHGFSSINAIMPSKSHHHIYCADTKTLSFDEPVTILSCIALNGLSHKICNTGAIFDLSSVPKGVYVITLRDSSNELFRIKLLI